LVGGGDDRATFLNARSSAFGSLLLRDISAMRLGRLYRNFRNGTKSRVSTRIDGRYGEVLLRSCGCIQEVLVVPV
jgi:hypothetical protein